MRLELEDMKKCAAANKAAKVQEKRRVAIAQPEVIYLDNQPPPPPPDTPSSPVSDDAEYDDDQSPLYKGELSLSKLQPPYNISLTSLCYFSLSNP